MSKDPLKYHSKILLITDLYPIDNSDNSIPYAIENIALGLKEFGYKVTIFRPNFLINTILRNHKTYKEGIYQRNGIKIYNKNFILPFVFNNFKTDEKFDLIISHMPSGNLYADLINKQLKLPHISIVHNSDYKVLSDLKYSIYFKNRLKKALENSSLVGARNCSLKKFLKTDFILPSFIENKYIIKKKTSQEKLKIITISRLIKRKNIDMVINALSKLNCDFEYDIYGDGKERKKLEKLIKKYKLNDKVIIHGAIEHNLIWEKLDKADIFILPSKDETFGLCYLEAMARGLITIAKKNESMDNIIKNNKTGFLVKNSNDIKDVLEKLNTKNKQSLIENTLDNIKNYTKEKIIENYSQIIQSAKFTNC